VFAIYLLQVTAMALVGSLVGVLSGVGVQQLLPAVLKDFLPVDVTPTPSWRAVLLGLGAGTWAAIAFALPPLVAIRRVPPLAALRRDFLDQPLPPDPLRPVAYVLLAVSLVALAILEVGAVRPGLWFSAGIAAALVVLWGAAVLLVRLLRRQFPSQLPYVWRQGLANLHRPQNQTSIVVLALGFGGFLLATLVVVQRVLLSQLDLDSGAASPNMVLIDLQRDQVDRAKAALAAEGITMSAPTAIVPMRITSVQGNTVTQLAGKEQDPDEAPPSGERNQRGPGDGGWALRREYRSTYREAPVSSEKLVAGRWWSGPHGVTDKTPVQVSIEQDVAKEIGAALGDEIVWDVQGVPVTTRVTSLRTVDWARFEPNFFVVFQPGALETAPQSLVVVAHAGDAAQRGRVQRRIAEALPNVTTIDLAQVQQSVETLVTKIVLAIRFMAAFSLVAGALVLVGAIATTRDQRAREGAVLRTIGATQGQVLRVLAAEYLALGTVAALCAVLLAVAAGWALSRYVFDSPFVVPLGSLAGLTLIVTLGTVLVGLAASLDAVRRTPLDVLRSE
jgi:putative ABC transport system permease protein